MTVEVKLGGRIHKGYVALIDDEDADRVLAHGWCLQSTGRSIGAVATIDGQRISLQRFVMGTPKGVWLDHINLNRLDCQKLNLRVCSPSQNRFNTSLPKNSRTGFKGVCFDIKHQRFKSHIQAHGKRKSLGYFMDATDAARAYDRAARELHGEFARLNFPRDGERLAA